MQKTKVEKHFDKVAKDYDFYKSKNSFYYQNLKKLLKSLIPANKNVLEVGCGTGDLLASLKPREGYGVDISSEMVKIASSRHKKKNLIFSVKWPNKDYIFTSKDGKYEYIFMSDVIEHLEKPEKTFKEISKLMNNKSKLVITMANPFWEPVLMLAEKMKLKMLEGPHKRITNYELKNIIEKTGMKITKHDYKLLIPVRISFITKFANKYLEKYFRRLAFIEYFVVRI
jgi:ubiquinone/menaquinone biosynthesis C-methylase UbiE